jgi:hypothetical protein
MFLFVTNTLILFVAAALGSANGTEKVEHNGNSCVGINAISPQCQTRETPYSRDFFYIGGHYQFNQALNSSILVDQMYVEKLTPHGGASKPYPIVLFTAGVPSGAVSPACHSRIHRQAKTTAGMAQHA